ncbi:MAG: hypothetical protein ACRC0V_06325 [Fusobacteriaceae bacterium]
MLKSSLLILFGINICFNDIRVLGMVFVVLIFLNVFTNKIFIKNLKLMKMFLLFYSTTFIFQFIFNQDGQVLFKFFNIYITVEGLKAFSLNFLRVMNLLFLSWLVNYHKIFNKNLGKYQRVIENVICMVPEVINIFKRRMKLKWFFRHILKQIKVKI